MDKFSFVKYDGENVVLVEKFWATGWIAKKITKTGLLKSINHIVFEQDVECAIDPISNIKKSELDRMKIYHQDFVDYYNTIINEKI